MDDDTTWHSRAACRKEWVDTNWFFPVDTGEEAPAYRGQVPRYTYDDDGLRAKLICAGCPVAKQCWAENKDAAVGIFAGTNEADRYRLADTARTRAIRSTGTKRSSRETLQLLPLPTFRAPSKPSNSLQIALYAFTHGLSVEEAAGIGEVCPQKLRGAIKERQRIAS